MILPPRRSHPQPASEEPIWGPVCDLGIARMFHPFAANLRRAARNDKSKSCPQPQTRQIGLDAGLFL
jgi:hypothetical protein